MVILEKLLKFLVFAAFLYSCNFSPQEQTEEKTFFQKKAEVEKQATLQSTNNPIPLPNQPAATCSQNVSNLSVGTTIDGTSDGGPVNVNCATGYVANHETVTCGSNGEFIEGTIACFAVGCSQNVSNLETGNSINGIFNGGLVEVKCATGFTANVSKVSCASNGEFLEGEILCIPNACSSTQVPNSEESEPNSIAGVTGQNVEVKCLPGYSGGGNVTCQPDGQFTTVSCDAITCSQNVSNLAFGSSISSVFGEDEATVNCMEGYTASSARATCGANGNFTEGIISCDAITCSQSVSNLASGSSISSVFAESGATVTCAAGYTASSATATCRADGNFVEGTISCIPITCTQENITNLESGTSVSNVFAENPTDVTCAAGYEANFKTVTCGADGNFVEGVISCIELVDQKNTNYLTADFGHNINLGDVCNPTGPDNSGVIHQVGKKMITVTNYPRLVTDEGQGICISSDDREPEYFTVKFKCLGNGVIDWSQSDFSGCSDFAERIFKCDEFGNPGIYVTQNNLTTFTRSDDNFESRYQTDNTWFDKLTNQYQHIAALCGSQNWSAQCIINPNSNSCYGAFGHDSINFPDQMFPTMLGGDLANSTPGYQGSLNPDLDSTVWSYFVVEPRATGSSIAKNTLATRRDPTVNFANYKTHKIDLSPFNNNVGATDHRTRTSLGYGQAKAFYNSSAIKEFRYMASPPSDNKEYYYDHIPMLFYGSGELPNLLDGEGKFLTANTNKYFSRVCEFGCKNLVITSHSNCDSISPTDQDTRYVCLPQNIDLSIHVYDAGNTLFQIKGFDDVKIYGLNFRIHGSPRFSEVYDHYLKTKAEGKWNNDEAQKVIDYLFPIIDYYYDLTDSTADIDYTSPSVAIVGNKSEIYPSFDPSNGRHTVWYSTILDNNKYDWKDLPNFGFSRSQSRTIWNLANNEGNILNAIDSGAPYKSGYEYLLGFADSYFTWNTARQIAPTDSCFEINNTEKLTISDVSLQCSVSGTAILPNAKKNIIHGFSLEGISLADFENFGFIFNEDYENEVGYLIYPYKYPAEFLDDENALRSDLSTEEVTSLDEFKTKFRTNYKKDFYVMGSGLGVANLGEQVRPDRISVDVAAADLADNFSLMYNMCQNINGETLNTSVCDPNNNYDLDGLFSPNKFFNPFYYEDQGPETRAPDPLLNPPNLFNNSVYLRSFNLDRNLNPYLQAKRENPIEPILIDTTTYPDAIRAAYNLNECTPFNKGVTPWAVDQVGQSSAQGVDDFCGAEGYYYSDAMEIDYLVISNSTFKNMSGNGVMISTFIDPINLGGNYELLMTNGINALVFNSVFYNQLVDMYDVNFRRTNLRTERNKNLVQLFERNVFAYGVQGKVTGEGTGEPIMKFSNNLFLNLPVGGYHGLFRSFYLHNGHLGLDNLLEDSQQTPLMYDYLKPYGVRHSIYNSAAYLNNSPLIYSSNYRPKQHGFDYNFNYNLYLGVISDFWYTTFGSRAYNYIKTPLLDNIFKSPIGSQGCFPECPNIDSSESYPFYSPYYGFYGFGKDEIGAFLGHYENTSFSFYYGLDKFLLKGSLANHLYDNNDGLINDINFSTNRSDFEYDQWGKIYPFDGTVQYFYGSLNSNFVKINKPVIGHTPRLTSSEFLNRAPASTSQRVTYLWESCYGNGDPVNDNYSLDYFVNDIDSSLSPTYRCITGDTGSIFSDPENQPTVVVDMFEAIANKNSLPQSDGEASNLSTVEEIVTMFDIKKNSPVVNECDNLKNYFENNLAPALHFGSPVLKTGMKLSVYRDFNGVYRKATTARGPFEIVGSTITCE